VAKEFNTKVAIVPIGISYDRVRKIVTSKVLENIKAGILKLIENMINAVSSITPFFSHAQFVT
jgi:hypothetical protein